MSCSIGNIERAAEQPRPIAHVAQTITAAQHFGQAGAIILNTQLQLRRITVCSDLHMACTGMPDHIRERLIDDGQHVLGTFFGKRLAIQAAEVDRDLHKGGESRIGCHLPQFFAES